MSSAKLNGPLGETQAAFSFLSTRKSTKPFILGGMSFLLLSAPALGGLLMLLVYIVVFLIVVGLLFWCIKSLCAAFGVPEPIRTVIIVLFVLIVVVAAVMWLLPMVGH